MSQIIHYRCDVCGNSTSKETGLTVYDDGKGGHICYSCQFKRHINNRDIIERVKYFSNPKQLRPFQMLPHLDLSYWEARDLIIPLYERHVLSEDDFNRLFDIFKRFYAETNEYERLALMISPQYDRATDTDGYVYVAKGTEGKFADKFKIGMSANPKTRVVGITSQYETKAELVCTIKTNWQKTLEEYMHKKYKDKLVEHEWFDLNEDDLEYLKLIARQSEAA